MSNSDPGPTDADSELPDEEAVSSETTDAEELALKNPLAGGDTKKQAQDDAEEPLGLTDVDGTPRGVEAKTLPAKLAALK